MTGPNRQQRRAGAIAEWTALVCVCPRCAMFTGWLELHRGMVTPVVLGSLERLATDGARLDTRLAAGDRSVRHG